MEIWFCGSLEVQFSRWGRSSDGPCKPWKASQENLRHWQAVANYYLKRNAQDVKFNIENALCSLQALHYNFNFNQTIFLILDSSNLTFPNMTYQNLSKWSSWFWSGEQVVWRTLFGLGDWSEPLTSIGSPELSPSQHCTSAWKSTNITVKINIPGFCCAVGSTIP